MKINFNNNNNSQNAFGREKLIFIIKQIY